MSTCGSGGLYCMPGGRTLMKGGTLGKRERRRGERSSQAIFTFAFCSYFNSYFYSYFPPTHVLLLRFLCLLDFLSVDFLYFPDLHFVLSTVVVCFDFLSYVQCSLIDWKASRPLTQSAFQEY